jgi:hypothetical protein
MFSSIKSISLVLLLLLLAGFFTSTAFCKEKPKDSVSSSMDSPSRFAGKLSICPPGEICIQFLTSHAKFTKVAAVGDLVMNKVPLEELTTAQADQHEFQKAAYIAYDAWERCQEAQELFKKGKISKVQMQWSCARYNKLSAEETLVGTQAILDNLGSQVEWAAPVYEISKLDFDNAEQAEQNAIDRGAEPTALGYEPPGEGETPSINLSDPSFNPNLILDTLPITDTSAATRTPATPG